MLHRCQSNEVSVQQKERGIVLLVTLLALVAMTLASVGMMRSVDTSILAVGNIAFRQAAEAPVDWAVEDAMQRLSVLDPDVSSGTGYFANIQVATHSIPDRLQDASPAGVFSQADAAGNTLYYMIERMCTQAGAPAAGQCAPALLAGEMNAGTSVIMPNRNTAGEYSNWYGYGNPSVGGGNSDGSYVYRVTVRVDGPNNTRAYAQAMVRL